MGVDDGQLGLQRRLGRALGQPALLGYVMLSTDITDTPAYSGKPVVTLIGMDVQGRYVGVKVLKHSEPILLLAHADRDTLFAAIMIICNGVVGLCLLVGGWHHREQVFRVQGIGPALAALLALSTLSLVLRNQAEASSSGTSGVTKAALLGLAPEPAARTPARELSPTATAPADSVIGVVNLPGSM